MYNLDLPSMSPILDVMPASIVIFNKNHIIYANKEFENVLQYTMNDLNQTEYINILHEAYREKFIKDLDAFLKGGILKTESELPVIRKDGEIVWVFYKHTLIKCDDEVQILTVFFDISEKKNNEYKIQRMIEIREAMLQITQSVIGVDNLNEVYHMILGKAISSIESAELGSIMLKQGEKLKLVAQKGFDEEYIKDFSITIDEAFLYKVSEGKMDRIYKIDNVNELPGSIPVPTNDDNEKFIKSTITAPIYIEGKFFGIVNVDSTKPGAFTDEDIKIMKIIITNVEIAISNHELYEEKVYLSRYDSLTNLYNRSYFEELFKNIISKATRYDESFYLVIIDLNDLKFTNDNYGHLMGDDFIRKFSSGLIRVTRKSDILARLGGDEFIGVYYQTSEEALLSKFELLLKELGEDPLIYKDNKINCSFSYGISCFPIDGTTLEELVKKADERMYNYKIQYKRIHNIQS